MTLLGNSRHGTEAMIDAFATDAEDRQQWLYALKQIRGAVGCPCTKTTHTVPRARSHATGMMWMEWGDFVPGRPVRSCGLCGGLGVDSPGWAS